MAKHDSESSRDLARQYHRSGVVVQGAAPGHKDRPKKRGDCAQGFRPCPWVTCRYHLFLEVNQRGTIVYRGAADLEGLRDMPYTCALDAAGDGPLSVSEIAAALNLTGTGTRLQLDQAFAAMRVKAGDPEHVPPQSPTRES